MNHTRSEHRSVLALSVTCALSYWDTMQPIGFSAIGLPNTEASMDVERLAKELSPLRYQTGHRFRNEEPFWERLNEDDLRGLLKALRDRGYIVSPDSSHVRAPSMYSPDYREDESGAGFGVCATPATSIRQG